ncbi:SRPBCC family protein [Vibrio jasicida]|uniref:SRPBCC family protein n=1 Tax=Vibrio jasicida TaxID=766224 RepID=UPI0016416227|nr:SRPBCC family protein [Vibrio jasicida]
MRIIYLIVIGVIVITIIGFFLPNPRVAIKTTQVSAPIDVVWNTITTYSSQTEWREDLQRVEIDEVKNEWTEIPNAGPSVTFKERVKTAPTLYEIEIVALSGFSGYSTIELIASDEGTKLTFTEVSEVSNPFRRILSFLFYNQSKRMELYIANLKAAVESG